MLLKAYLTTCLVTTLGLCHGLLEDQGTTLTNLHGRAKRNVSPWSPRQAHAKREGMNGDRDGTLAKTPIRCGLQYNSHDFRHSDSVSCQSDIFWKYNCTMSTCSLPYGHDPFNDMYMTCNQNPKPEEAGDNVLVKVYTVDLKSMVVNALGYKDGDLVNNQLEKWYCYIEKDSRNGDRPECGTCQAFWYDDVPLEDLAKSPKAKGSTEPKRRY